VIALREGVQSVEQEGVRTHVLEERLDEDDRREVEAYRRTAAGRKQSDGRELFDDLLHKSNFIKSFDALRGRLDVQPGHRVLELGGGQGWASALLKRHHPEAYVVASDLAPEAFHFTHLYEKLLDVAIDEKWAFDVRSMPFTGDQFDRIFTFAAFHHFGRRGEYGEAIAEILRVLKPGGAAWLLYEPSSPKWLYKRAFRRVNRRLEGDGVAEDVLVVSRLRTEVERIGGTLQAMPNPEPAFREGVKQTLYYAGLKRLPFGSRLLVSTINLVLRKPEPS
jgi:ubiquinone/menaquinone biosynthesis C-methylase UbiE